VSIRSDPEIFDRSLITSATVPVKLCRGNRVMILLYGSAAPTVRAALKRADLLIGSVLAGELLATAKSVWAYDYFFLGAAGDRSQLFRCALRDCARSGWLLSKPDPDSRVKLTQFPKLSPATDLSRV